MTAKSDFEKRLASYLKLWCNPLSSTTSTDDYEKAIASLPSLPEIPSNIWPWYWNTNKETNNIIYCNSAQVLQKVDSLKNENKNIDDEYAICNNNRNIIIFPKSLTSKERSVVHNLSSKLNIYHVSVGEGENRCIALSKDGDFTELFATLGIESDDLVGNAPMGTSDCQWFDSTVIKPIHIKPLYFLLSNAEINRKQNVIKQCAKLGYHNDIQFPLFDPNYVHKNATSNNLKDVETDLANYWSMNLDHFYDTNTTESTSHCNYFNELPSTHTKGSVYFVNDIDRLSQLVNILNNEQVIGFDCEMHSYRSYYPITCLIQISTPLANYIIDTLALWSSIGPILGPVFANPKIIKIGHAICTMDVPCLFRDFGIIIISAFDTQIAASLLGSKQQGLAKVLETWKCPMTNDIIENKWKMKSCDWRLRPLTLDMAIYAATDVHYLIPLYYLFITALIKLNTKASKGASENSIKKMLSYQKKISKTMKSENIKVQKIKNKNGIKKNSKASINNDTDVNMTKTNINISTDQYGVTSNTDITEDDDEEGLYVFNSQNENNKYVDDDDDCFKNEESRSDLLDNDDDLNVEFNDKFHDNDNINDEDEDEDLWEGWGVDKNTTTTTNNNNNNNNQINNNSNSSHVKAKSKDSKSTNVADNSNSTTITNLNIDLTDHNNKNINKNIDDEVHTSASVVITSTSNSNIPLNESIQSAITDNNSIITENTIPTPMVTEAVIQPYNTISEKLGSFFILFLSFNILILACLISFDTFHELPNKFNHYIKTILIDNTNNKPVMIPLASYLTWCLQVFVNIFNNYTKTRRFGLMSRLKHLSGFGKSMIVLTAFGLFIASLVDFIRIAFLGLPSLILFGHIEPEQIEDSDDHLPHYLKKKTKPNSTYADDLKAQKSVKPDYIKKNIFYPESDSVFIFEKDLVSDTRLLEILHVFISTTRICSGLWSPSQDSRSYTKVPGFRERKNRKTNPLSDKTVFIFEKLFEWRESEAIKRDESVGYICPAHLLLEVAERLPRTLKELSILMSPLPHSMRQIPSSANVIVASENSNINSAVTTTENTENHRDVSVKPSSFDNNGNYEGPVDMISAVIDAIQAWGNDMQHS